MTARVLADRELGERLVGEAREHVRRFDWVDVAERTAATYDALLRSEAERRGEATGSRP